MKSKKRGEADERVQEKPKVRSAPRLDRVPREPGSTIAGQRVLGCPRLSRGIPWQLLRLLNYYSPTKCTYLCFFDMQTITIPPTR